MSRPVRPTPFPGDRLRRPRASACVLGGALVLVLASACVSTTSQESGLFPESAGGDANAASDAGAPGPAYTGDEYLEAGDFEHAAIEFEKSLAVRPGDRATEEKLRTAKRLAAQEHATLAAQAAQRNDWERAAFELKKAEMFDADAAPVRRLREQLGVKLEAAREIQAAKGRAKELLVNDPAAAVVALTELRRKAAYDPEIVELLTDATRRVEADRAADRASEAWQAGLRQRTVEHLAAADVGGRPSPRAVALRKRMEADLVTETSDADLGALRDAWRVAVDAKLTTGTTDLIRDRLVAALAREVRAHETAGRPATAALFELEARQTGARVDSPNLDRVRGVRAIRVHVAPFNDATGGSVDGMRLARALRDRIAIDSAGGSGALIATSDIAPAGAAYPHIVVQGTATSQRITAGRAGRETKRVRYVVGTRDTTNPVASKLNDDLTAARARLGRAQDQLAVAETNLRHLRSLGYGRGAGGTIPTEGDAALQSQIAGAEAAVENARRTSDVAKRDEFGVRQQILATPSAVSEPVWDDAAVEIETLIKTAEIVATVRVLDGDRVLLDEPVTGSEVHRETVSAGVPAAGLAADPDDTPDDAAMAVLASARLADAAAGRVRDAAERAARRLLEEARAAERAGDPPAAAESYAVFLLSTTDAATPERAAAARALFEILGVAPALRTGFRPETRR